MSKEKETVCPRCTSGNYSAEDSIVELCPVCDSIMLKQLWDKYNNTNVEAETDRFHNQLVKLCS